MIKKLLLIVFPLCLISLCFVALPALADGIDDLNPTFPDIYSLADEILGRIPYFLGGFAFLALLYSGAIYITSFGDPTRMESAKKNLTWTVTGILAVMSIYGIMKLVMWVAQVTPIT